MLPDVCKCLSLCLPTGENPNLATVKWYLAEYYIPTKISCGYVTYLAKVACGKGVAFKEART